MAETPERVLVYDRVDANRRASRLLLTAFAIVLLPVGAYLAIYLMLWVAMVLGILVSASDLADLFTGDGGLAAFAVLDAFISVLILLLVAYFQFRFASAIVLRLAGAHAINRDEAPEFWRTTENLCIGAGLPQPRLYVVEGPAANAFCTGLDPESASLVVTRGLMRLLDRRELEGVLAHELAQIGNHDTRLSTVLAAGSALLRLPLAIMVAVFRFPFRIHWALGWGLLLYLGLPLLASIAFAISAADDILEADLLTGLIFIGSLALPFYVFLGAPLLTYIIRRLVLRQREFLADADAVLLTRDAEPLATALAKIGGAGGAQTKVSGATVHLYFVEPLAADAPWWDRVFSTHPPIEERIALLADMGDGIPPSALREAVEAGVRFRAVGTRLTVPEAGQIQVQPLAGDDKSCVGVTEPGDVKRAPVAFCLGEAGAALYAGPDAASVQLAQLPYGALITVLETAGDFLRVITSDDSFGFIPRTTEMSEVDLKAGHGRR